MRRFFQISLIALFISFASADVLGARDLMTLKQSDTVRTSGNTVTIVAHKLAEETLIFAGGDGGKLDSFSLSSEGKLSLLKTYDLWNQAGPARGLVTATIQNNDFLFVGNKGGNAIEVYGIGENGDLTRVFVIEDTADTHLGTVITLEVVQMGQAYYLFAGGLEKEPGLSSFKIQPDGNLSHIQSVKDDDTIFTDGIIGMSVEKISGKTYLTVGGFQDSGVSSFEVFNDGTFKNVSNIADNETHFLNGTYPLETVSLGGKFYAVVGHRHHSHYKRGGFIKREIPSFHGDGVNVFRLDESGKLSPQSRIKDGGLLTLTGQTRIAIMKIDDAQAIVAIASR